MKKKLKWRWVDRWYVFEWMDFICLVCFDCGVCFFMNKCIVVKYECNVVRSQGSFFEFLKDFVVVLDDGDGVIWLKKKKVIFVSLNYFDL